MKKKQKIQEQIDNLYFQYVPNEFIREFYYGPEDEMLKIKNSPHYRFLLTYQEIGDQILKPENFNQTHYIQLMIAWGRDLKHNTWKTKRFVNTYENIKSKGLNSPITIVRKPLYQKLFKKGYEIYHGHHRAACCLALNYDKITCIFK